MDIHCHVFNADDLPVRGFVQHLHLDTPMLGPMLSALVDRVVQGAAPGYERDMPRIQALLARSAAPMESAAAEMAEPGGSRPAAGTPSVSFEERAEAALDELLAEDPVFVRRLSAAVEAETARQGAKAPEATAESFGDRLAGARRAMKWAQLFGMSRLDVARQLVADFDDAVDLFCPLLVDLGMGLGDRPKTSVQQQVEMLSGISILSMRGHLPGGGKARLHPFVGFDPRGHVRAVLAGQPVTPLDVVKDAVLVYGFVGVKVYPPMGWRPLGNIATIDMTSAEAEVLDVELRKFYRWCVDEEVPITAHANRTNYADASFADFAGPTGWARVLREFPDLRLNLGHFGGAKATTPKSGWPRAMSALAVSRDFVHADTGNHPIHDHDIASGYFALLEQIFEDPKTQLMNQRLMYGSDWFMLALMPDHQQFLETYSRLYSERFTQAQTAAFRGANALRFLGFQPGSKNATRLRAHYARHAPGREPHWLEVAD